MIDMNSEVSLTRLDAIKTPSRHSENPPEDDLILQQLNRGGILRTTEIEITTYEDVGMMFTNIHSEDQRHPWRERSR